jgi:phage-related protein
MKESSHSKKPSSPAASSQQPFFQRKADEAMTDHQYFFNAVQPKLTVNTVDDPYEREADQVADQVVKGSENSLSNPEAGPFAVQGKWTIHRKPFIQKAEDDKEVQAKVATDLQRSGLLEDAPDQDTSDVQTKSEAGNSPQPSQGFESKLSVSKGGGAPLDPGIQGKMETGIGADFSNVKVHQGDSATHMSNQIGARAFTHGNDIYFNEGEYDTNSVQGQHLIAHELTHTVQQGASIQTKPGVIHKGADRVQRIADWILEELNDYARYIPGWTLFTVIIGYNPLLRRSVERNAPNLVQGLLELIPIFGVLLYNKLNELGVLQEAFTWVENQLNDLDLSLSRLERAIDNAWEDVSIVRSLDYNIGVLDRHFGSLYRDVVTFAGRVGDKVLELIKNALVSLLKAFAESVPGYSLLTKILGKDPLTDEPVEATTAEIIADFLMLIGAERELQKMQEEGTLKETADWIDEQLAILDFSFTEIKGLFEQTWESFSFEDVRDPVGAYNRVVNIWSPFLTRVGNFAYNVATKVVEFIKNALLSQLKAIALETRGYHLLTVLLGKDPFTQEVVPRSIENIIRGFMSLMEGGEQQFQEMKASGAIARTTQRVNAAVAELGFSWEYIVGLFTSLWNSFTIDDIFDPFGAFGRIINTFAEPLFRLIRFIVKIVRIVIEVILEIMQFPTHLIGQIINNIQQAWEQIKARPIEFIKNLLRSVKQGFVQFFDNIGTHLLNGVSGWLFKELEDAGITPPQDFSLGSILQLVMQVLGITMDRIWEKIGERIGPERVERIRGMIDRLEGAWAFIRDVMENGPSAIWSYVSDMLGNLWDLVLGAVKNWAMTRIIQAVTTKLLSMLDPTGIMAVVNSFIAIFRAIQSFIAYLREMLETFARFVEGVLAVAMGNLKPAADKLEQSLGNAMPIVIGFLANQVGLQGLGRRIGEMIAGVQERVDRALDWLIDRAVSAGRAVLNSVMGGGQPEEAQEREEQYGPEKAAQVEAGLNTVRTEESRLAQNGKISREQADQVANTVRQNHPVFTSFTVVDGGDSWNYQYAASPGQELDTPTGKAEATLPSGVEIGTLILDSETETVFRIATLNSETSQVQMDINGGSGSLTVYLEDFVTRFTNGQYSLAEPEVPAREVTPPFSNSTKASSLRVKYIYKPRDASLGSTPGSQDLFGAWTQLQGMNLVGAGLAQWVRFHLLNHNIGGPGVSSNLIPMRKNYNGEYESEFESDMKTMFDQRNEFDMNKVLWFNASVTYGHSGVFSPFPSQYQAEGGEMEYSGGNWEPKPEATINWGRGSIGEPIPEAISNMIPINSLPQDNNQLRDIVEDSTISTGLAEFIRSQSGSFSSVNDIIGAIDASSESDGRKSNWRSQITNAGSQGKLDFS